MHNGDWLVSIKRGVVKLNVSIIEKTQSIETFTVNKRAGGSLYNGGKRLMRLDCHSATLAMRSEKKTEPLLCADTDFEQRRSVWPHYKRRIAKEHPGKYLINLSFINQSSQDFRII